jgi:hypothetical protein
VYSVPPPLTAQENGWAGAGSPQSTTSFINALSG